MLCSPRMAEDAPLWKPRAWLAAIMNFVAPGWGHAYVGQAVPAMVVPLLYDLWQTGLLIGMAFALTRASRFSLLLILAVVRAAGMPLFAYVMARRRQPVAEKRWFQRWYSLLLYPLTTGLLVSVVVGLLLPWVD